jgi:D-arabinose 1-dehydrogenase-like Zn-dependent alcohol dehydrogenase
MKAAVVRSFDAPPRYEDFDLPPSSDADEFVVDVLAAGLHPRVRSGAAGRHYADEPVLPMIPGVDAVGRTPDGKLVYCVVHDTPYGTMAQQAVAHRRRCIPLPDGTDTTLIAAAMNPGMSSWIALRLRAPIQKGQSVFILGATGNAGRMAIQIAKLLGAGRVVGAGRKVSRLESSGADEIVSLLGDREAVAEAIGKAAGESDIVLDYLWSEPAAQAMKALAAVSGSTRNGSFPTLRAWESSAARHCYAPPEQLQSAPCWSTVMRVEAMVPLTSWSASKLPLMSYGRRSKVPVYDTPLGLRLIVSMRLNEPSGVGGAIEAGFHCQPK